MEQKDPADASWSSGMPVKASRRNFIKGFGIVSLKGKKAHAIQPASLPFVKLLPKPHTLNYFNT